MVSQFPQDLGAEVAFIGRSNSGKSSALNTVTNIKNLARTSSTPGRTQLINFFTLTEQQRLVDLPGYGYAKAPKPLQRRWQQLTQEYLRSRECLRGLILLMDIRHPFKDSDQAYIEWCIESELPLHLLLTKADKLKKSQMTSTLLSAKQAVEQYSLISVQIFSSLKRLGLEDLQRQLSNWLQIA